MSEQQNEPVGDVGEAQTAAEDPTLLEQVLAVQEPAIVRVLAEPEQVRIGGQAGVRVTQLGGVVAVKRVTPYNDESDHKAVPVAVLEEVRVVLDNIGSLQVPPAAVGDALRVVRDLLAPWL